MQAITWAVRASVSGSWRWNQPSSAEVWPGQIACWIASESCGPTPERRHSSISPSARLSVEPSPGRTTAPDRSIRNSPAP